MADRTSKFSAWFLGELAALAPGWFGAMFLGRPQARTLSFAPGAKGIERRGSGLFAPEALLSGEIAGRAARRAEVVDVALPERFFLRREVAVPAAAARSLTQAAALDLTRRTPFRPEDVHWVLGPARRGGGMATAVQWVARRADLEALRRRLAACGLTLRRVGLAGSPELGAIAEFSGVGTWARFWRRLNGALLGFALAAAVTHWLLPGLTAARAVGAAEAQRAALRADALALRREVDALRTREFERGAFLDAVLRSPRLAEALRELTIALPDDVWLEEIAFQPEGLSFAGETASSAAGLVLDLSKVPVFGNPRLSGPVSRTADGTERFEIALDLELDR